MVITGAQAGRDIIAAREVHIHEEDQTPPRSLHQLPPPPAAFTGREEELRELEQQLSSAQAAGGTISGVQAGLQGMGGVGKTALAVMLAHRLKDRYPDAQFYLDLRGADPDRRPPVPPAEAMQSVIHAFHPEARLPDTIEALAGTYYSVLANAGRALLLFDSAANAEQVRPLVPPANCLLLVTSRAQFTLPGLTTRKLDCLPPAKSQELLVKLAARLQGEADQAAELCGHLPLALEVFAGTVRDKRLYPVAELLERLRGQQDKLAPVEASFQVSYDLLADDLRRRWTLLAVFPASFDLRAAAAVWAEGEDSARERMQALADASVVEWNEGNGRFRLHDLVRQFCDGKLSGEARDAARMRYAQHYQRVACEADELYLQGGHGVLGGLELFDRERVHLEAAFEWLRQRQEKESAELLVALVDAVVSVSDLRFHPQQRLRWCEAHRDAARLVGNRGQEANALGNLANAHKDLGDTSKAVECYERQLEIAREIRDRRAEGNALGNLGRAYLGMGEARKAIEFTEMALLVFREIGDRGGEGAGLGSLGNAYAASGETRKAIRSHEQHLDIAREMGDRRAEGNALGNLGNAYAALGDARKAIEFYEQRLLIARELKDLRGEGTGLGNLASAHLALGDAHKANELFQRRLAIALEFGDVRGEATALWNSALALHGLGKRLEAMTRAEASLKVFERIEDPNALKIRAWLANRQGDAKRGG